MRQYRKNYLMNQLAESDLIPDALLMFRKWFEEALSASDEEANAMCLSTVSKKGKPSSRIVLLKEVTHNGFVFFTNYSGRKTQELSSNPFACLNFFWPWMERQVRVEGQVEMTTAYESDAYFATRPRGSQLGAWASAQSSVIASRQEIEDKLRFYEKQFEDREIPRPENWGGLILIPEAIEFWQGRENRLHDRFLYTRSGSANWIIQRLSP